MRTRSPVLYYVATLVTSGIFVFFWLYTMMADLNAINGRRVINARVITAVLVVIAIYGTSIIAIGNPAREASEPFHTLVVIFVVTWLLMVIGIFILMTRIYALTLKAEDRNFTFGNAASIVGLSLLWWASLPYLQVKINRLVRKSRYKKTAVEVFA
jgi:hypothetical protein